MNDIKYVVVCGGVISGIGKGVISSSIGLLFQNLGAKVTNIKIDPYLNVDAGTMSPFEHGEVFVLDDGGEVDLDLGNYERWIDERLTHDCNITTGKIYLNVIQKERDGNYFLGKTVQVVPHITDEVQDWIERVSKKNLYSSEHMNKKKIAVIELGGTIGDIEGMPFIEALRQFQFRVGKENFCCVLVSLVPIIGEEFEQKTKPTQHAVKELRSLGLNPDLIVCRSIKPLTKSTIKKLSLFCQVEEKQVISCYDVSNLYKIPIILFEQEICEFLQKKFNYSNPEKPDIKKWSEYSEKIEKLKEIKEENTIRIAIVGKYTGSSDSYHSITKSIQHAGIHLSKKVEYFFINSEHLIHNLSETKEYQEDWSKIKKANGIIIPGGFAIRGIEGKILVAEYARINKIPYLGICLGMQIALIDFARNVLQWEKANSVEFDKLTTHPVVIEMLEFSPHQKGGTMRLGLKQTYFKSNVNSILKKLYGDKTMIEERHRHRYEANPEHISKFEENGLIFVAQDSSGKRQEIIELLNHPYFVGVQYHPEFLSRPFTPSPPFIGLISAASEHNSNKK